MVGIIETGRYELMSMPNDEIERIFRHLNDSNKLVAESFLAWLLEKQVDNDNEKLTDEDIQEIEQARRELANGETTSLEELKRALKISG